MLIYLQTIETEEDKSKFEDIYREYRGLMYYVAYKRLHHEQDAEDAVHYAFMKIAENIKIIDPVSPKTKQLVVTIVDNRVTDMLRMNGRHPTAEYNDEILNHLSAELHTGDLLTEAILKLPEQQRHVIWLKYYHGYNLREISKMLGITLSWAQKIDQRAKKQLENCTKKEAANFDHCERLRAAAEKSSDLYLCCMEEGYDAIPPHEFSEPFERKIRKLKKRADHPYFYKMMQKLPLLYLQFSLAEVLGGRRYRG